jgi:thiamine biosynthesis lipoprotein
VKGSVGRTDRWNPTEAALGAEPQLHRPAYEWALSSTTIRVVTADAHALSSARRLVDTELTRVELAAGRERRDSEVATLPTGRRTHISGTLTAILAAALQAAHETDGVLDPTVHRPLQPVDESERWRGIELDERAGTVLLPRGVELEMGAVARAWAADRCAAVVAETLDVGVLVSLGGDIATAGPAGGGAWEILVQDRPEDPAALVAIPAGLAVVTSTSASSRTYRAVSVVAPSCVTATTWSVAALADTGPGVVGLEQRGLPARLVHPDGTVRHTGGWPDDAEMIATRTELER